MKQQDEVPRTRRGPLLGFGVGLVALGCCVGPTVAALIGLTSATVAFDLATDLYAEWGWAFKAAAVGLAAAIVVVVKRRANRCATEPRLMRFVAVLALSALVTYGALYAGTTWLGKHAAVSATEALVIRGATTRDRVSSAIEQLQVRYPTTRFALEGVSDKAVRVRTGWVNPDVDPLSQEYNEEISRRVGDMREATFLLLRAIARDMPRIRYFTAFEDEIFVPTWSRRQILSDIPAARFRDFDTYTSFVMRAETLGGYSQLH